MTPIRQQGDPGDDRFPRLVVFDCDGTLVDTERIGVRVGCLMFRELGLDLSEDEVAHRFVGCSQEHWEAEVASAAGGVVPDGWARRYEEAVDRALEAELQPVPGAVHLLDELERIGTPYALASNSGPDAIRRSLRLTGLQDRFDGRIHSAHDVARGKPAPDVYLAAAAAHGVDPQDCWVVEDSPFGVEAALAAGMRTFAFTGGLHPAERLLRPGALELKRLPDLVPLVVAA